MPLLHTMAALPRATVWHLQGIVPFSFYTYRFIYIYIYIILEREEEEEEEVCLEEEGFVLDYGTVHAYT